MQAQESVPTLLLPALLTNGELFREQRAALSRFGDVLDATTSGHRTLPRIAASVLESAPPRFSIVGLSLGGRIAMEIVRQAPERVVRLALIGTSARTESAEQRTRRRSQIDLVRRGCFSELVTAMYPHMVHPSRHQDNTLRKTYEAMANEVGPQTFVDHQLALIMRSDIRESLGAIPCPTLVVVGSDDRITPLDNAEELAAGIPNSRLVVIPDCGHLSTLERPAETTETLLDWIEET